MKNSKIEWTDHTFNPWIGCTKVSPGCANCYAASSTFVRAQRSRGTELWGKGQARWKTSDANWRKPLMWNKEIFAECDGCGRRGPVASIENTRPCPECQRLESLGAVRPRVFCASLADWLDDEVPIEWLADLLKLIHDTPNLDWLLLTKRPENWQDRIAAAMEFVDRKWLTGETHIRTEIGTWLGEWLEATAPHRGRAEIPSNVWLGTTVENQEFADKRIPALLKIPARVRFLSCEPLLGSVDLTRLEADESLGVTYNALTGFGSWNTERVADPIHWVICGGESGPGARSMDPIWVRTIRHQCQIAGVPFFFKQWGEWSPCFAGAEIWIDGALTIGKGDFTGHAKIGKKRAGRLLDGREWNEVPK